MIPSKILKIAGLAGVTVLQAIIGRSQAISVSIKEPANGACINASWVDMSGTFSAKNLKQIIVGDESAPIQILAEITGNTFEARNVLLEQGTNRIVVVAEDMAGNTATNTIMVMGPTDTNTARTFPVQVKVQPGSGFAPLQVTLTVQAHVPGKIERVFYDFDGDHGPDQTNFDLQPIAHVYNTGGEFFPVVTVQSSAGRFSSLSGLAGMLAGAFGNDNAVAFINVQAPPILLSTIKIADPVDVKWTATSNLYVLSGNTATITEFNADGKTLRSVRSIGTNPSGFDVDQAGSIYVAVTGDNQIKKFKPTADSFEPDASFGNAGVIGNKGGSGGSNQLNAPFDVKLSGDGVALIVSDSRNQRLRKFTIHGEVVPEESEMAGLNTPLGLDESPSPDGGLLMVDSGNNRIVLVPADLTSADFSSAKTSGTNGTALGQFNGATHLSANERGLYVADTGNSRVQIFRPFTMRSEMPLNPRAALPG